MNVLLLYPRCPDTYWSFKHALQFVSKKAAVPPLGLITVSAMLPEGWNKKLVDLNIAELIDTDLHWADYVFISAMYVQRESVSVILAKCAQFAVKVVAGGPLFTQDYKDYPMVDYFVLNEAEITLPLFLNDLQVGAPKNIYKTNCFADMSESPIPDYYLLDRKAYFVMNMQVSRGCPFACDFCEITALLGRKVRMKSAAQILKELDVLYKLKWRGTIAVVDDNFIGKIKQVKTKLLPAIMQWVKKHKHPFDFNAQTSINLADDEELMQMMTAVGFGSTFIGIETPVAESLKSCHKVQNENRDLLKSIAAIQNAGLLVSGGFIVGFDSDSASVFQRQIDFIQKSGIVSAMVGLLNAPKNTRLYRQLKGENRLTVDATGSNTDSTMNFIPLMDVEVLMNGYQNIIKGIYSAKPFYKRARKLLKNYKPERFRRARFDLTKLKAFFKSILIIGILHKGRLEYWKFLLWTLFCKPSLFIDAVTFAVYGYHYRMTYKLH